MTTDNVIMWVTLLSIRDSSIPRLKFCWRPGEDSKSTLGGILCIFGSRTFVPSKVQGINVSIPQVYGIRNHFVGCWVANGWIICAFDLCDVVTKMLRFFFCGNAERNRHTTQPINPHGTSWPIRPPREGLQNRARNRRHPRAHVARAWVPQESWRKTLRTKWRASASTSVAKR